jgi:ferrous iron transport protein B
MEWPSYKIPSWRTVGIRVWMAARSFLVRAGTVIFAATIVIWALSYFPRSQSVQDDFAARRAVAQEQLAGAQLDTALARLESQEQRALLENSAMGRLGHLIQPVFEPMGWDWRISMATLASFPAREVVVSQLGITFDLGGDFDLEDEAQASAMRDKLRTAKRADGSRLFNLPVALSLMVFFALCIQCVSTLATMYRETGQWRWPVLAFVYLTGLAYLGAVVTYQLGMAMGLQSVGM